ncbi:MAG: hypothetical protein WCR20_24105 [Verrucomicrobiota bacterium]
MATKGVKKVKKPKTPAKKIAPKPLTAAQKLDAVGIEAIASEIENGLTFGEIAGNHAVALTCLHDWLDKHPDISARAREKSAEAWLDRGLSVIESALRKTGGVDAGAARAYAQECARRASIRNSKYRDKIAVGGDADAPAIKHNIAVSFVAP